MTLERRHIQGMPPADFRGHCLRCEREHRLENNVPLALATIEQLFHQLDHDSTFQPVRTALETMPGKMLGVLVAEDSTGHHQTLRAYSGEVAGRRDWPAWVGPVLRREDTAELERETLAKITVLDARIAACDFDHVRHQLRAERREVSRVLSKAIYDAAAVTNARGERRPLREVFVGEGIAGGTTDCTVPKLLEAANVSRLKPIALAEAWWGPTINGRHHGDVQHPCARKCVPILGYLLCGH